MLNRTQAPPFAAIRYQPIKEVTCDQTNDGIPIYYLYDSQHPVVKLELKLESGIRYEQKLGESWFTGKMLMEGTKNKSGNEITQTFERLGAFVEINPGFDDVSIAVYGMRKNFPEVLALLQEILNESAFPEKELKTLKQTRSDQIRLNDAKSDMMASKKIREAVFGGSHPYGRALTTAQIETINQNDLMDYYHNQFFNEPSLFISGQVDNDLLDCIKKGFVISKTPTVLPDWGEVNSTKHILVEREDSVQSSIKIAWNIPDMAAVDYFDYLITNAVLGGYFGSRLMKNIREDKGYTYGISGYPIHLRHSSFGIISTDVKAEYAQATLDEVWKEVEMLRQGEIDSEEIDMVVNYLSGKFQASLTTPFQLMSKFTKIHNAGLMYDHYEKYFEALNSFTTIQVQRAIAKYFDADQAHVVVVGPRLN